MNRARLALTSSALLLIPFVQAASADIPVPLLSSVVRHADGSPAANVKVLMLLAPTTDSTTPVKETVIAQTTTDQSGNFSFGSPNMSSSVLDAALANGGILNVGIMAMIPPPPPAPNNPVSAPGTDGTVSDVSNFEYGLEYTSFHLTTEANVPSELVPDDEADQFNPLMLDGVYTGDSGVDPSFSPPGPPVENPITCDNPYTSKIDTKYPQSVAVEFHTYLDMNASFTYGKTADSVIETGLSKSSSSGWSADGSTHTSNSGSTQLTWNYGDHFARKLSTTFQVNEYKTVENCPSQTYTWYESIPQKWVANQYTGTTDLSSRDGSSAFYAQPVKYRGYYVPNGDFYRDSSKAHTFAGGVNVFGFGASIRSGYSTNVKLHYHFGPANYTHNLFGRDGHPGDTATTIFAY
jgi:hypothetical protein